MKCFRYSNNGMRFPLLLVLITIFLSKYNLAENECPLNEKLTIGKANQGGYVFEYQSGRGKECRIYQMRNTPGGVMTPAAWKDETEVFLSTNIPSCKKGDTCPWIESVKTSSSDVFKGRTDLSYGINKDEFHDNPDAIRKKVKEDKTYRPYITLLRGIVADSKDRPIAINVSVSSSVQVKGSEFVINYKVQTMGTTTPLKLLAHPEDQGSGILWAPLQSSAINQTKHSVLTAGIPLEASITAKSIVANENLVLQIIQEPNFTLIAATAPAYIPGE